MITIDQLLESVELDFEPRWITKDTFGTIVLWNEKPTADEEIGVWNCCKSATTMYSNLKLSEFDGKDWTECIYEVPRKEEPKDKIKIGTLYIDQSVTLGDGHDDDVGFALEDYEVPRKTTGKIEKIHIPDMDEVAESAMYSKELAKRLNQVIDAVNELKGAKNE